MQVQGQSGKQAHLNDFFLYPIKVKKINNFGI